MVWQPWWQAVSEAPHVLPRLVSEEPVWFHPRSMEATPSPPAFARQPLVLLERTLHLSLALDECQFGKTDRVLPKSEVGTGLLARTRRAQARPILARIRWALTATGNSPRSSPPPSPDAHPYIQA